MHREAVAAEVSLAYAQTFMEDVGSDFPKSDYPHLVQMAKDMATMDDALKRNRYLGWIQACICVAASSSEGFNGDAVFEEMLNINRPIFR